MDAGHHFFLCDQVVDSLKQTKQALHISTPFVQNIVCISGLREADNSGGSIDFGVNGLRSDQLADILLRLIFRQIEQLGQAWHLDAGIVFGDDTNIVLNDTLAEILPSLICLLVCRLALRRIEHICAAKVWPKQLGNFWPSHEFVNGEEFQQLCVEGDLVGSSVFLYAVEKVGLLVVVGSKDDIVDDSLQDLEKLG